MSTVGIDDIEVFRAEFSQGQALGSPGNGLRGIVAQKNGIDVRRPAARLHQTDLRRLAVLEKRG